MRALLFFVLLLGLLPAGRAAEAATGRVLKVLPFYLDAQGRDALSPSLFDRDAYQAQLRAGTNAIAGIFAREVNGLTLRNMRVVWTGPKNAIYGEALDEAQIQNLTLDHDTFSSAP